MGDFGAYGEEADETEVKDIKGITDKVTEYTYSDLSYPCIMFREGFSCPQHKMKVISNMVKSTGEDKDISLYFISKGELFKLGRLSGGQVDPLIDLVGLEVLQGYYMDGTKLEGDKLYTLSII